MSTMASAFRAEIMRVARREIRKETTVLKKASAQYRRDVAALKRQVASLQKSNALLQRKVLSGPVKAADDAENIRFSPKGLKAQRERLGLSAADYAKLAGVSALSVYNWEKGKARPRKEQVATLAALRGITKKEVAARMAVLG